jgi:hypothetical protein
MNFRKLDIQFNVDVLEKELDAVLARYPLTNDRRQLCLTNIPGSVDPLWDAAGRGKYLETAYSHFNAEFEGTIFEEIVRQSPFRLGRVRLMMIPPRACYSFHRDTEPRLHVALKTNENSFLMIEDGDRFERIHIPMDGHMYWVDTMKVHTAINSDAVQDRIHLVATILEK